MEAKTVTDESVLFRFQTRCICDDGTLQSDCSQGDRARFYNVCPSKQAEKNQNFSEYCILKVTTNALGVYMLVFEGFSVSFL